MRKVRAIGDTFGNRVLAIATEDDFNALAIDIYNFQRKEVPIYRSYVEALHHRFQEPLHYSDIPFLPISFFKNSKVLVQEITADRKFLSSGTSQVQRSAHWIPNTDWYAKIALEGFEREYGPLKDYTILALLPNYMEQGDSSLVFMVKQWMKKSPSCLNGFFLQDYEQLYGILRLLQRKRQKTVLIGVTYALLDFLERYSVKFPELIVMETGGMKGRRKEMIRKEVHDQLKKGFGVESIHSEYGMTELLSQAYSKKDGIFSLPPWMRILISDLNDPLSKVPDEQTGGINIIDLANFYSCAFISTQDLGKAYPGGGFEVLGRFDHSDIRGCNLMIGS
jgi:hypothetical protein